MKLKLTPEGNVRFPYLFGKMFTLVSITGKYAKLADESGACEYVDTETLSAYSTCSEQDVREYEWRKLLESKINKLARSIPMYAERLMSMSTDKLEAVLQKNPCSGKTTAVALEYIVRAIRNPGVPIALIHDHSGDPTCIDSTLWRLVEELINKLGFKFFVTDAVKNTLTYEI